MTINYKDLHQELSREVIPQALFENYESIYAIDIETSAYQCFYESDSYSSLLIGGNGDDFFGTLHDNIIRTIYSEDQEFVQDKMKKSAILEGLQKGKYYTFVYRLMIDGKPLYHKFRATLGTVSDRPHILIGIRNVDAAFRQDKAQSEELSALQKKEKNHLEAILASAAGYMEVNLSRDLILEFSSSVTEELPPSLKDSGSSEPLSYSEFENWRTRFWVFDNKDKYRQISGRHYLIRCFQNGERRASVSFSTKSEDGQIQPCKKVYYLYQDDATRDIFSFCVIYDLTEQQRRDKELRDLESELQMSRIRNFTSQMQPHFLYNALGSIQEIVLEDPEYASELIGDFTTHLRSCIRAMSSDAPLPFKQELANIKAYVNIEKMRLGDRLHVIYNIMTDNFSIVPLSVQPVVENAIRHGVYQRGERGGTVLIQTREMEDSWQITVQDTGVGFDVEAFQKNLSNGGDSTGLKNIMFRLSKVMGGTVDITSTKGTGTTVIITVPKEREI